MRRSRGFTLIEFVIVIGIVAICVGVAIYSAQRNREVMTIDRASSMLKVRFERAQSLAQVAGSRLGTARVQPNAPCVITPNPYLWIQINPNGQMVIPSDLVLNADGTVQLNCELFDLTVNTRGEGTLSAPAAAVTFGFTADGRVVLPAAPGGTGDVFVNVRQANGNRSFGFRVLPSGVICRASNPTIAPDPCDEEV